MAAHQQIDYGEFERIAPAAVAALRALGKAVDESGLDKGLTELLKVRSSQLNGCAFCLQFHLNMARRLGVAPEKLDLVAVWREAGIFSERERAALAWTEVLTLAPGGDIEPRRAALAAAFSETEIAFLTVSIGNINAWNRIAGPLGFAPPIPRRSEGSAAA
jgi:AhpD family alkylhydroperoxidase